MAKLVAGDCRCDFQWTVEMMREIPGDGVRDHTLVGKIRGQCRSPAAWRNLRSVFLKSC